MRQDIHAESLRLGEAGVVGQPGSPLNPPENNTLSQISTAARIHSGTRVSAATRAKIPQPRESFLVTHEAEMFTRHPTITSPTALSCLKVVFPIVLRSLMQALSDGFQSLQDRPRVHELRSCQAQCSQTASAARIPARNAPSIRPSASQSPHTASPISGSKSVLRPSGSEH